jgi:hypothetical protein
MRYYTTNFLLKTTPERFDGVILPWLKSEIGYKRGTKADWSINVEYPTKSRPRFFGSVQFNHQHDAIRFILKFENDLAENAFVFIGDYFQKGKYYSVDGWENLKPVIKWLNGNLPPRSWHLRGGPKSWSIRPDTDEARVAIALLLPPARSFMVT